MEKDQEGCREGKRGKGSEGKLDTGRKKEEGQQNEGWREGVIESRDRELRQSVCCVLCQRFTQALAIYS